MTEAVPKTDVAMTAPSLTGIAVRDSVVNFQHGSTTEGEFTISTIG
jgi:hypothetical protein